MNNNILYENYQQVTHYEIMGIGLKVLALQGESKLFHYIDEAMRGPDWKALSRLRAVVEELPPTQQEHIMSNTGDEEIVLKAMKSLEDKLGLNSKRKSKKSA